MEKNDVQSGGQDPVPKQLFGGLIYSTGHLVQPLRTLLRHSQSPFKNIKGRIEEPLARRSGLTPIVNT